MLYDADTHFVPFEVLASIDPVLYQRKRHQCKPPPDYWTAFYNKIKDSSWPGCSSAEDFHTLPLNIRQEIKDQHLIHGMYIPDSLEWVYYAQPEDEWPNLEQMDMASCLILKTDRQVLNPHGTENLISYHGDKDYAISFMRAYHRIMQDICTKNPRFSTPMWLPLQHFQESMDELEHYQADGFFGVRMLDHHPWGYIHQVRPFFQYCAEHRIPLYLHTGPNGTKREDMPFNWTVDYDDATYNLLIDSFGTGRFSGKGFVWIMSALSFIYGGILDLCPTLRIVSSENGTSWIPRTRAWCLKNGLQDPLPYFQQNFWFTVEPEESDFLSVAELLGWDRLLYATDWPHEDPGGANRYQDLATVQSFLAHGQITKKNMDLLGMKNYVRLLDRLD